MSKEKRKGRIMWGFIYVGVFIAVFISSVIFKLKHDPNKGALSVDWNDSMGTVETDLFYGEGELNNYDLYLPADNTVHTIKSSRSLHRCV